MLRFIRHILLIFLAAAFLQSCGRPRLIPRDTLSEMYARMFMVDQWVEEHPDLRQAADSLFVYGEIFDCYGYSPDDYRYSVEEYLREPDKFLVIMDKTKRILQDSLDVVNRLDSLDRRSSIIKEESKLLQRGGKGFKLARDIFSGYYPHDTVCTGTGRGAERFILRIPQLDTVFSGPAMIVKSEMPDSLSGRNSVENAPRPPLMYGPSHPNAGPLPLKN